MLVVRRCPFTGVVNFFTDDDPHLAVGSIARCGTAAPSADAGFTWRCYDMDAPSAGLAPDRETAERRLTNYFAMVRSMAPDGVGETAA
jgi:hypothetical protein